MYTAKDIIKGFITVLSLIIGFLLIVFSDVMLIGILLIIVGVILLISNIKKEKEIFGKQTPIYKLGSENQIVHNDKDETNDDKSKGKKTLKIIALIVVLLLCSNFIRSFVKGFIWGTEQAFSGNETTTTLSTTEEHKSEEANNRSIKIKEEREIIKNGYFEYKDVVFLYLGNYEFRITNNAKKDVIISAAIYGKKKDGSYKWLESPAFGGLDEYQYQKDLETDGWAVYENTNRVRAGKSQNMTMTIFELTTDDVKLDVDNDGMYDINFGLSFQDEPDGFRISTADPETPYYKIKAK